jgi:hypothetical protein
MGNDDMKKFFAPALVACFLALAACGGQGDDTAGDNVADQADAQADNMEVMADNMSGVAEDNMEANASAVREAVRMPKSASMRLMPTQRLLTPCNLREGRHRLPPFEQTNEQVRSGPLHPGAAAGQAGAPAPFLLAP